MFVAIEMQTCDITGSRSLTKTASATAGWRQSLDQCVRTPTKVSKRCNTKKWITGKLNIGLGLLTTELQSGRLSPAITHVCTTKCNN